MWRKRPDKNIKQGSSKEEIEYDIMNVIDTTKDTYKDMLESGIAPEMARMILPQCMMTEWLWSGSLYAFSRVCNLRNKDNSKDNNKDRQFCYKF